MNDYITQVFEDGGLFASQLPGYEVRKGQVAIARMVDQAMRTGCHTLGEGPCGTGKTMGYCVPAAWHCHHQDKRVVIATANIGLQEQLVRKDLPMLARLLPWSFSFALLKGRNNYLCHDRLAESEARGELTGFDQSLQTQIDDLLAWSDKTETGDVSELGFVPSPQVWSRFSVGSDECKSADCSFREECCSERAREIAQEADIVVTNYHLLFAHLAVRKEAGQASVLPPFDYLILDEAHEAAEIAREFFGFTVSEFTIGRLASAAADFGNKELATQLRQNARQLFDRLADYARSHKHHKRLMVPGVAQVGPLQRSLLALTALANARIENRALTKDQRATARNVSRNASIACARLGEVVQLADANKVYWIDLDTKGRAKLRAKPIDVSGLLRAELFGRCASVSLMSATLATAGCFQFARRELGVPDHALELVVDSPFDFESQALLVVPDGLPDPREPEFVDSAAAVFREVLDLCNGRTLGLFTSYKNLNAVYDRIVGGPHRVLRQGDLPRSELTRLFARDVSSVLLGTDSFWTGVDVPGESLTGLVIDKLPFPRPDDPVIEAICERDPTAFHNYLVPRAIIALRQGVGRLIRSKTDIGVVVILDRRIAEKGYGRRFLKSLPPMLSTRRVENIRRFLLEAAYARAS